MAEETEDGIQLLNFGCIPSSASSGIERINNAPTIAQGVSSYFVVMHGVVLLS